jgi:hypothetical protein
MSQVTTVSLCGTQGCCPAVELHHDEKEVIITDDFGGKVKLTQAQWQMARTSPKLDFK